MHTSLRPVAAAAAVFALAASPASAWHQATPEEAAAIGRSTFVSAIPGEALGCYEAHISDVDPTWGKERFAGEPFQNGCGGGGNGPGLVHNTPVGWIEVAATVLPEAVALDLGVLRSTRIYVSQIETYVFAYKPRTIIQGVHSDYTNIRWHGWGSPVAVGRGSYASGSTGMERAGVIPVGGWRVPVRVVLSHPRICSSDPAGFEVKRTYTIETITFFLPRSPNGQRNGLQKAKLHLECRS